MPILASHGIQADIAVLPGLLVQMTGAALTDLLEALLAAVIHHARARHVLTTAVDRGAQIHISVTDDAAGADLAARSDGIRSLAERVAMHGGALDIDVRLGEGTTITLRLPAAPGDHALTDRRREHHASVRPQRVAPALQPEW
ncbi:hypothetical protein [Rhodopila sp.]|uniref:hypothetical protein n=1 Tax=Rhodopila sp. TaxID=2480087 RepID=UPI003D0AB6E5